MEEAQLHIVIVGHVDHGKSTLIGRLFYDTGSLSPEQMEGLKAASKSMGKELDFAYLMDHLEEERQKGITIDIAHTFFKTAKRKYVIIDAPGHKEFLKNMITGTSQAEAALLLLDIEQGIQEQTRRHCSILSLFGIEQVAVLVNKMDLVDYSEEKFSKTKEEILSVLGQLKIHPTYIIPVSASKGENITGKSSNMSWFEGPSVLESIDNFDSLKIEEKSLRFPIQDIYGDGAQALAVGRVEAGLLRKGQEVSILPDGQQDRIVEIKKFMQDDMSVSHTGDCVGVRMEGNVLKRGHILVDEVTSNVTDTIHANIFWMADIEYKIGIPVTWRCATQEVTGKIERIYKRFDAASIKVVEKDANHIEPAEIAEVEIKLEEKVVVDRFAEVPELGRFILEHRGNPIAGGIII